MADGIMIEVLGYTWESLLGRSGENSWILCCLVDGLFSGGLIAAVAYDMG